MSVTDPPPVEREPLAAAPPEPQNGTEPPATSSSDVAVVATLDASARKKSNPLVSILKLAVVVAVVGWLVWKGAIPLDKVSRALGSASWWSQTVPLALAALLIVSFRWWVLLRAESIDVELWPAVRLCFIGHFWNNVLPGAVSGDLAKMYYVGPHAPGRRAEAYTTIVLDRIIGLVALVVIAFAAALANRDFIFDPAHQQLRRTFYVMVACLVASFLGGGALVLGVGRQSALADAVRGRAPFLQSVRRGYHTLLRFGSHKKAIVLTFAMSIVSHSLLVLIAYISGQALAQSELSPKSYAFLVPIGLFVNSVPIGAPGGAGTGEFAFNELFEWAGAAAGMGAGVMILLRIAQFTLAAVGALFYILDKKHAQAATANTH